MTARRLDAEQQHTLLEVAAATIHDVLMPRHPAPLDVGVYDEELRAPGATFVTLERDHALLGCIGTLEPVRPLVGDVGHNAAAAAFSDPRLPPVTCDDYAAMSIEISVLGPL